MQIFIARNNQHYGPYTLNQIQTYLASGQVQGTDLAWYAGLQSWIPLSQVPGVQLPQVQAPPPLPTTVQLAETPAPSTLDKFLHGPVNKAMPCPHCHVKGHVHTQHTKRKKGVSGGKATAAVLTGGLSLLAVGLSRKEQFTEAYCGNCKNTWVF